MAGLRSGVNDRVGLDLFEHIKHRLAVADVVFVMMKVCDLAGQLVLIPTRIAFRSEKGCALIVVDAVNLPSALREIQTHLRTDQTR